MYPIYTVFTVVLPRIQEGKSTFACFIDFQKAFDWVNTDLLAFRRIKMGIDGKFYDAIKLFIGLQLPVFRSMTSGLAGFQPLTM